MGKKKGIDCPILLSGCGAICVEVGKVIGYPKRSYETCLIAVGTPNELRIGAHEYRYVCLSCGKEWLLDTLYNLIFPMKRASLVPARGLTSRRK